MPAPYMMTNSFSKPTPLLSGSLSYTIFATHMENLSELATIYPNVKILHFDVDIKNSRLDFKVIFVSSFD